MYPWCFSLQDHLRCMVKEKYSLHLIEKEQFRTALLYQLFTVLHGQRIYHWKCEHCWRQDSSNLKDVLDVFFYHGLDDDIDNNIDLNNTSFQNNSISSSSHIVLECCESTKCIERIFAATAKQDSDGFVHVIIKLPGTSYATQQIFDGFLPSCNWYVLTDSLLYDNKQWQYVDANVESASRDIECLNFHNLSGSSNSIDNKEELQPGLSENLKCILVEIEKWYQQQLLLINKDMEINNGVIKTKRNTSELHSSNNVKTTSEHFANGTDIYGNSFESCTSKPTNYDVEDKNERFSNSEDTGDETKINIVKLPDHKCYIICSSLQDTSNLTARLSARYGQREGVRVRCLTNAYQGVLETDGCADCRIYFIVMTAELFLASRIGSVDLVLLDAGSKTYVDYVEMNVKLFTMHAGNVIFMKSYNHESIKLYENMLRRKVSVIYMAPRMSADYCILKSLCDSFSTTTFSKVDLEIQRTYTENITNGSVAVQSVIYLPIVSMVSCVAKGETVTMPMGSSKEELMINSDESALRNAIELLKDIQELDGDGKVLNRSSEEEDVKKFVDIKQKETENEDVLEHLICPEEKVNVCTLKMTEVTSKDGSDVTSQPLDSECLGVCVKKCLNQIPVFTFYDHYGSFQVVSQYSFSIEVSKEDFITIQKFQACVFETVCNMKLKNKAYLEERTDCKIVLLREEAERWYIDYARMNEVLDDFNILFELGGKNARMMSDHEMHCDEGVLVLPKHTLPEMKRPLLVMRDQGSWLTVADEFPDQSKAGTYQEYYSTKYGIYIPESEAMVPLKHLKFVLSCINTVDFSERKKPSGKQMDIPQLLCCIYPLSFYLWRKFCLLPSILYRLKQAATVQKLLHELAIISDTGHLPVIYSTQLERALILPSAIDNEDNEELEFYGDAVLKYAIIAQLFLDNPRKSESYMSFHKSKIVANEKLYEIGIAKQLYKYLFHEKFNPKILNAYLTIENHPYKSTDFAKQFNKVIPNVTESLLGALFIADSTHERSNLWITLLRWYGFDIATFEKFLKEKRYKMETFNHESVTGFSYLTTFMPRLENVLKYKFKEPLLYLEACSHVTYSRRLNSWTHSNQRLECIGDAVLDIMVTTALINRNEKESRKYDHGDLSEMRSFIVCTYVLAVVAVQMDLHKHLKFMSTSHLPYLKKWVEKVQQLQQSSSLYSEKFYEAYVSCDGDKHVEVPKDIADCFEAVVGAVYLDVGGNLEKTWECFEKYFEEVFDICFAHMPISIYYYLASLSPDGQFELLPRQINGDYCWRWSKGNIDIIRTGRTSKVAKGRVVMAAVELLDKTVVDTC